MRPSLASFALVGALASTTVACAVEDEWARLSPEWITLAARQGAEPAAVLQASSLRALRAVAAAALDTAADATVVKQAAVDSANSAFRASVALMDADAAQLQADMRDDDEQAESATGAVEGTPLLGIVGRQVVVFARPDSQSTKIGFLRAGAQLRRSAEPVRGVGCRGGWYSVAPEGYVCAGAHATTDLSHPVLQAVTALPDRGTGLPYVYGRSRAPAPFVFTAVPDAAALRGIAARNGEFAGELLRAMPAALARTGAAAARAVARSAVAFASFVESGGVAFGLTTALELVPLSGVTRIAPPAFRGVVLDETTPLPVAFARHNAAVFEGGPSAGLRSSRRLQPREALPLTGRRERIGSAIFLETQASGWVREDHVLRVDGRERLPAAARAGKKWIDVSINAQTLVAYEGARPVYVTLISSGKDGLGDPATTHSTVLGQFLIHTKHVSATMDSDEVGDEYDLRDVPYVQYFNQGYALHAAYWHDAFGSPRSHGCINLSPADARWLFHWTDPPVPQGWHAALSLRDGTLIDIHP
jgi:hypothetical protein